MMMPSIPKHIIQPILANSPLGDPLRLSSIFFLQEKKPTNPFQLDKDLQLTIPLTWLVFGDDLTISEDVVSLFEGLRCMPELRIDTKLLMELNCVTVMNIGCKDDRIITNGNAFQSSFGLLKFANLEDATLFRLRCT